MSTQFQTNFLTQRFENLIFKENVERSMSQESSEVDYEVAIAEADDKNIIIDHARKYFNLDEPLNQFVGLTGPDGKCPELEDYLISSLEERTSVKAVCNGKLVGISMNGIVHRNDEVEESNINNPKFKKIIDFLHHAAKNYDLFKMYPNVEKALSVKIISVDPIMRGKGVATKLVEKSREIGRGMGCKLIYVECSSHFSALIMEKFGFEKIYSINYADYKVNGETVFKPKKPHTTFVVYAQEL